jgi:hypothetical protein
LGYMAGLKAPLSECSHDKDCRVDDKAFKQIYKEIET